MSNMQTLTIGGLKFEVNDEVARALIQTLQSELRTAQSNINTLQEAAETARNDIDTVMGATVTPDTSLSTSGAAADAEATGRELEKLQNQINSITPSSIGAVDKDDDDYVRSVNGVTGTVTLNMVQSINGKNGSVRIRNGNGTTINTSEDGDITITNNSVADVITGANLEEIENGHIRIEYTDGTTKAVKVKGLKSAAYTNSDDYMPKFTFTYTESDGVLKINTNS